MQVLLMGSSNFAIDIIKFLSTTEHIVSYITTNNRLEENLHRLVDSVIHASPEDSLMEDLRRSDIDNADAFIALSDDDNSNAMAAQIAKHIVRVPRVLCLVNNLNRKDTYTNLGLTVACPNDIAIGATRDMLGT